MCCCPSHLAFLHAPSQRLIFYSPMCTLLFHGLLTTFCKPTSCLIRKPQKEFLKGRCCFMSVFRLPGPHGQLLYELKLKSLLKRRVQFRLIASLTACAHGKVRSLSKRSYNQLQNNRINYQFN